MILQLIQEITIKYILMPLKIINMRLILMIITGFIQMFSQKTLLELILEITMKSHLIISPIMKSPYFQITRTIF